MNINPIDHPDVEKFARMKADKKIKKEEMERIMKEK